jgi:glycogen synthase
MLQDVKFAHPDHGEPAVSARSHVADVSSGRQPLRVLLVTPRFFPLMGGVENHVYQVARRLARAGVEATILTTDPLGQWPAMEQIEGIWILRVKSYPAVQDFYFAPEIYRVITNGRWDIVHVQSYHTLVAPIAMLAALRANIPYVVTFHGGGHSSWMRNSLRVGHQLLLRPLLSRAVRFVAIARFEVELYGDRLKLPRDRFVYIPNGADIVATPSAAPGAPDGRLIASIGRVERYKGHHRVLAALPHILRERPDTRLWIAGEGPYEAELWRMARELGVADRVEIRAIPVTDRQSMAREIASTALVMLLSEYETHPIAILEAVALGRPALVADTSGLSELAQRGLVRAIPLRSSAEHVAAAVLDQLREPFVPRNVDLPTWDDCAADLLTLYATVRTNGTKEREA